MARPRKEDELDIPRRAVEEMVRLMAARGDFNVPLKAVAEAVGCVPSALYSHFRDKNALLLAVRDAGFATLYETKRALSGDAETDPIGFLQRGSLAYARFALDNPVLYRLMFSPPPELGVGDDPWAGEIGRQLLALLLCGLRSAQRKGHVPGVELKQLGFMFWSTVHGAVSLAIQSTKLEPEAREQMAVDAIDTLMRTITATRQTD